MAQPLEILRQLTEGARTAGSLTAGIGRYSRTPDFSAPAYASTRPTSDRGTTFHFSHKSKSKANDLAEGNHSQTTSAAHQGYIERPSATEGCNSDVSLALRIKSPSLPGDDGLSSAFSYPERIVEPGVISFGTLGASKVERRNFWNLVEASEARRSRVQHRIIAELPAELDKMDRALIARDFCQNFEDRRLPYWATLHAPSKANDARNYHLHITYFDRPAGRSRTGEWDFSVQEERKKKSGNRYLVRPFKNGKHPDTRDIGWPKRLRRSFADASNFYLSMAGLSKRHDPRSYADSGILKEPTEHLGNKRSALESFGLETDAGQRNAKREIRWRIERAEAPWRERAFAVRDAEHLQGDEMADQRNALFDIASRGITEARRGASYDITAKLLTIRATRRENFLEVEVRRLSDKDDLSDLAHTSAAVVSLSSEAQLIEDRREKIALLARNCGSRSAMHNDRSRTLAEVFDRRFSDTDPDTLFKNHGQDEFSPIDDLIGDSSQSFEMPDGLEITTDDALDIADLVADLGIKVPEQEAGVDGRQGSKSDEVEDVPELIDDAVAHSRDPFGRTRRKRDPIEDIIAKLSDPENSIPDVRATDLAKEDFPDAWAIDRTASPQDIRTLDRKLAETNNRSLRHAAIASRDATDLCPPGGLKDSLNRGWIVLRFEAERRGLDIDTGIHDRSRATDAERAVLHSDQDPCPIRVVRKNIARQRVRG